MFEEPAEPRAFSGRALGETTHEDLEVYGVSELEQRILTLQAEIERTKAQLAKKKRRPRRGQCAVWPPGLTVPLRFR